MVSKKRGIFLVVLAVFFVILLSNFLSSAEVGGCYIYSGGSEDLYCIEGILQSEAEQDCADYSNCDIATHFIPGSDCSEFSECQEVTCKSDCQTHARGKCAVIGSSEVPENEFPIWCSPGCCKISNKFCQFNLNKWQCEDKAKKLGFSTYDIFDNSIGMSTNKCNQIYCGVEVAKASLEGYIKDGENNPLPNAEVSLEGTDYKKITGSTGKYSFTDLNPGTYLIKVKADGFVSASEAISLSPAEAAEKDFTLVAAAGLASIQGMVKDGIGNAVPGATVSWAGLVSGQVFTNENGGYLIENILPGEYTITASKIGYSAQIKPVSLMEGIVTPLNFIIASAAFEGIEGKTYLDKNNNNVLDGSDEAVYGVKIYLNDVFKSFSQYPDGNYQLSLKATVQAQYKIKATYQEYSYEKSVQLSPGQSLKQDLLLSKYIGECTYPNPPKNVEEFYIEHVPGKEEVILRWVKPCPEVLNYLITKKQGEDKLDEFTVSPADNFKIDDNVEWGKTYTYEIVAVYDQAQLSQNPASAAITLGDEECEGKYFEATGWDLFCAIGDNQERKKIWSCDNENKLVVSKDCSENDAPREIYFCAEAGQHNAVCKNAGVCSSQAQQADPFGLYYEREACYGSANPENEGAANYCYYDFTDSIVNSCNRCDEAETCFDYKSKDACVINSCLGVECEWIDGAQKNPLLDYSLLFPGLSVPEFVTSETGAGYCTEKNYDDDDQCKLCGPQAGLFENFFCTADVCSGLGKCFSNSVTENKPLSSCSACGDEATVNTNCYTYTFEKECNGGQNLEKNDRQEITLSKDRCGWERCVWQGLSGGAGSCVKDGDGDNEDDCSQFANAGERNSCRKDNKAPATKIISGVSVISLANSNLTFQAKDSENPLGVLGYCLAGASSTVCTNFEEKAFAGKLKDETITLNFAETSFLQKQIPGETYMLKYYSKDKYFNQEKLQTAFIYIDNVPPEFEINENISTKEDLTRLSAYLEGASEPMACSFDLEQILPAGSKQTKAVSQEVEKKEAVFENLNGVKFNLTVTCTDNNGNEQVKEKVYTFDLEEKINIIQPKLYGAVAFTSIVFKVETIAGAACELYTANNEKVADFVSDEAGKSHQTPPVSGFVEKEYAGEYKAVCRELLGPETYEDYFNFAVDFTAPETQIILQEGARQVKPSGFGWEEFFVDSVSVSFECTSAGFGCVKTFYCLGDGCELINNPNYKEYKNLFILNGSTEICYYSLDEASNPVYQPICGKIKVEGFGITLELPELFYYNDEMWGISNQNIFTWQFFTKVPTVQCKFDFTPSFNYEIMPQHKVKDINARGKYLVEKFPQSVFSEYPGGGGVKAAYVKCKNSENELGPEQKINLEYDPTAPSIERAYADPSQIFEDISTNLIAVTDDKTVCRYSDNSEGTGSVEYEMMEYSFPGADENADGNILETEHKGIFSINFLGAQKEYKLNIMCKNGAGDFSGVGEISFLVDYSAVGNILSISPSGFTNVPDVTLVVETTKRGVCEYKQGTEFVAFPEGADTRVQAAPLGILAEKKYIIPVRCTMEDHTAEAAAEFTVDLSAPVVTKVEDGISTCGKSERNVMAYTTDENISGYAYEIYEVGEANITASSTMSAQKVKVLEGTVGPGLPIKIPTADLVEGYAYTVVISAGDAAGNWGEGKESDGFVVSSYNLTLCTEDEGAPGIVVYINDSSCTAVYAELYCEDVTGCEIDYGKDYSSSLCQAELPYTGLKIPFEKSGWICYSAADSVGNNYTGLKEVIFSDDDGDGVLDRCDECPNTGAGKIVDEIGCASGEAPESVKKVDSDNDGLPDYWEKLYDEVSCELNYASPDSNDDGLADNLEDYDLDSLSNFEEYAGAYNPCLADAVGGMEEVVVEKEQMPEAAAKEEGDVLAWSFLILGLLMFLGGAGYLSYYYLSAGKGRMPPARKVSASAGIGVPSAGPSARPSAGAGIIESWKQKLTQFKRQREARLKARKRQALFGAFSTESARIPHVDESLSAKGSHVSKLGDLARKYAVHKEEIKPGLRREERSIFTKLENIAEKTKVQSIHEVVNENEAKALFEKLRRISRKRKE